MCFVFGGAGSSLLLSGFLWLERAGAAPQWRSLDSLQRLLPVEHGLSGTQASVAAAPGL